jgi:two-component sensor histidine kinase
MPRMANYNPAFTPEERRKAIAQAVSSHPLEMFPWFRRWPQGQLRDLVYTFIWNLGFAALFTLFGMVGGGKLPNANWLWINFVTANCVGFTLHALYALGGCTIERRAREAGAVPTTLYYMVISTVGVIIGFWLATKVIGRNFLGDFGDPRWFLAVAFASFVISVVIAIIYFWREKSALAEAALEREQRRAADIEREALAANLRALQAQVEPHFLFNTLANVTSLIDPDPARARHMLEAFIRFLRASLAATRRSATTLADEFALIADFLEVLKVRMGERLQVAVDLPAGLAAVQIPPMLVQPLVENAIRHGLEPKVEGGRLDLRARREGGRLVLEVSDTGMGFGEATSGGVGLANIRERLRLAHGDGARLAIRANSPQGTVVSIELPWGGP